MKNRYNFFVIALIVSMLLIANSCKEEPLVELPETSKLSISEIGKTSINYSFVLIDNNGGNITEIGICWDTLNHPTTSKSKQALNAASVEFSETLDELIPDNLYYIRSYAINSAGIGYSETISFETYSSNYEGTIQDIETNEYEIISIGNQIWMSENLKTTKLNDNTPIQHITDNSEWSDSNFPAYSWYLNDEAENNEINGALYNHYAIETGKLCPQGYHIPTVQDWETLENYLMSNGYNYDGSTSGKKFAKSLASKYNWADSNVAGSVGNNPHTNNRTGFNLYPSGIRNNSGDFLSQNYMSSFWTADILNEENAYSIDLFNSISAVYINNYPKTNGFSVRCIKD